MECKYCKNSIPEGNFLVEVEGYGSFCSEYCHQYLSDEVRDLPTKKTVPPPLKSTKGK